MTMDPHSVRVESCRPGDECKGLTLKVEWQGGGGGEGPEEERGDAAHLVESRTGMPLMQVRFPGASRDFSPMVNFQCRFSELTVSVHLRVQSHALTSVRADVEDPGVHVRVRWMMETLKNTP